MKQETRSIFTSQESLKLEDTSFPPRLPPREKHIDVDHSPGARAPDLFDVEGRGSTSEQGKTSERLEIQRHGTEIKEANDMVVLPLSPQNLTGTYDPTSLASIKARGEHMAFHDQDEPSAAPHESGYKRSRDGNGESDHASSSEPASKRSRRVKPRHTLDPSSIPTGFASHTTHPLSPLFFSHSPRQRPPLPTSFSSEAVATILHKSRDESPSLTTLRLARGHMTSSSPPATVGTPRSSTSLGRGSTPRSPEQAGDQSVIQALGSVSLLELLDQDDRPTFIVDLANGTNYKPGPLQVLFANNALIQDQLLGIVTGKVDFDSPNITGLSTFPEFKAWALSFVKQNEPLDLSLPSFLYAGYSWTCSHLKKRFRVISSNSNQVNSKATAGLSPPDKVSSVALLKESMDVDHPGKVASEPQDYFGNAVPDPELYGHSQLDSTVESPALLISKGVFADASLSGVSPATVGNIMPSDEVLPEIASTVTSSSSTLEATDSGHQGPTDNISSFDWTRLPVTPSLPPHIQFARNVDWASTSLGPVETWDFDLRMMSNLVMGSPHPAAMYWGKDHVAIYNEAYVLLAGNKHPELMGQPYKIAWAEIWDEIEEVFENAIQSGQATMKDDDRLFVKRNGYLEESYFSWSIIPLVGEQGTVVGLYNPAFEKTRRKIAERRMLTLRDVGEKTAAARDLKGFWRKMIDGLRSNEYDVPFAFLYSVSEDMDSEISSMQSGSLSGTPQCILEGTLGVPLDHPTRLSPLDLKGSDQSWGPYLREAAKTDKPVLLSTEDPILQNLTTKLEYRGFGDPPRSVVVCPIHPTTGEAILGFLVMGINPRRPFDDDYSLFIQLLSRQLATSMASVVLFEEEIRRGQRAARLAALDRIELSKQLDLRTKEAAESETKFTRMAEFAPVGMFIANSHGSITYSNDTWWEITRHPREENSADNWMDSVMDKDREAVRSVWNKLVVDTIPVTHEFRVKAPWQDRDGNKGETWVLMNAYPEKKENGALQSIFGSLTNISQQKWAEDFQKRRMEEAVELKRQQENFIDIISHELRNPQAASLQSADEIISILSDYRDGRSQAHISELLENSIDAAQIIALCAQHQKRIVDDVLTLSKLDAHLLLITPVEVQPTSVIEKALRMFQGEFNKSDIQVQFLIENSYHDLKIDWVRLDPSRLLQVLINLITNAIKFTQTKAHRRITLSIGASLDRPKDQNGLQYLPRSKGRKDMTTTSDWGSGEDLFLHVEVQDTGRGLDENEKKLLFQRFSQTSPRTHVTYGGSGLGLFISRELTELQGGEIGVSSQAGVGSTFGFYVKARRATKPERLETEPGFQSPTVKDLVQKNSSSVSDQAKDVLIVEDNLVNQKVLSKQLSRIGCVVSTANHGVEALDFLQQTNCWRGNPNGKPLSVVLMDLEMPVMDGLTCVKKIRELQARGQILHHIPVIAVTANVRSEQIAAARESGMDGVVTKPFRITELIPEMERLVLEAMK